MSTISHQLVKQLKFCINYGCGIASYAQIKKYTLFVRASLFVYQYRLARTVHSRAKMA